MNTITKYVVLLTLCLIVNMVSAQEQKNDSVIDTNGAFKDVQIEKLEKLKEQIKTQEREFLKSEVDAINRKLDNEEITVGQAEALKKEAAQKRALNIEDRLAIIDNKIALIKRNEYKSVNLDEGDESVSVSIGSEGFSIDLSNDVKKKPKKYDRRTTGDLVFGIGFNNSLIDGQSLDDSPYKLAGSGFVELGYAWKTRIFDDTNFWRLKYGFSFTWNKFDIKDNNYLVNTDGAITLEEFPTNLNKAKFRTNNLVFPVHLEFGPSKKKEYDTHFRYSTRRQIKIGLGGYAGFNIGSLQKLKYKADGENIKNKQRGGFEVSEFVYGLSGYVALGGVAVYMKYDLNPLFKNQVIEQNNISLGLRFDMD